MKPAEEKAALEKLRTEGLTERERQVLEKGISNLEFHYLGSAKILGGIGKGLAEAMAELKQLKRHQLMKTSLLSLALVAFFAAPVPALAAGKGQP